jgi:tyrosyl-tRNA synthetase
VVPRDLTLVLYRTGVFYFAGKGFAFSAKKGGVFVAMLMPQEQLKIILKGAQAVVSEEDLLRKLEAAYKDNRPLTVKLGLDPSAPDIHLGHAVVLRKIRQLQDLGHRAVIVIGDFTGKIGDPTGKARGRAALSDEQVRVNAETYCEQIFKVIDRDKTEVRFNSQWLKKLSFEDVIKLTASTTVARILERDDFSSRYKNQTPIGLHEFLYPLMQAYDSVELISDIELGGTDQTFNILMGRTLQKHLGQEPQVALFMPILEGLDGIEKMSKSLNNYIGVSEAPEIMFKKVMELPDNLIIRFFELATDEHPDTIEAIRKKLECGANPRDLKYSLAELITKLYHGEEAMLKAREYFDTTFCLGSIPRDIPTLNCCCGTFQSLIPELIKQGYINSKSDFLRLLNQGGVQLNCEKVGAELLNRAVCGSDLLRIGKKKFLRLNIV